MMLKKKKVDTAIEDEEETPMAPYRPESSITVTEITAEDLATAPVVLNFDPEKPLEFADALVTVLDETVVEELPKETEAIEVDKIDTTTYVDLRRFISEELHQAILRYQEHLNRGARLEAAFYESQIHEELKKYDVH